MTPPDPGKSRSSTEPEKEGEEAGIASDEALQQGGGDPHLPASESEELGEETQRRPPASRRLTNLPPD